MMKHVKDASERCRKGSSSNMKDVRRKHFLPASKYWTNINENLSEVAEVGVRKQSLDPTSTRRMWSFLTKFIERAHMMDM